jgi:hypothetical protein
LDTGPDFSGDDDFDEEDGSDDEDGDEEEEEEEGEEQGMPGAQGPGAGEKIRPGWLISIDIIRGSAWLCSYQQSFAPSC